ncbi:CocE/NonD family hydrolase [Nocardioides luteus]|nr:CocE/NonD family hydrolase [Nocardioides luteus]
MRDGVELATDVYEPEDGTMGTILIRTPYSRDGLIAHLTAGFFASPGYLVVNQSCRGTFGSGGDFAPFSQEVEDGADTVAWLRRQPWFGGRFALWGASYLGFTAWATMMDPPPELVAAVIAASTHDNHQAAHGAGAFSLEETVGLLDAFGHLGAGTLENILLGVSSGRRLAPAYDELPLVRARETVFADSTMPYVEWLTAPDADDPVWRTMRLDQALERIDVPVLLQGGWQERFLDQMIAQYSRLRARGVDVGLTIGPWTHIEIATKAAGLLMTETLDWLAEHLAETGLRERSSPVRIYVTAADEWRSLPQWPPLRNDRVLYLRPDGELGDAQPAPDAGPTTFTFDPGDPTPSVGGRIIHPTRGGYRDNRKLEKRADVLTFTTPPLREALGVIGTPVVEMAHHTDNPHADLFVRLCEVGRRGKSVNVSDGFRRLGPEDANGTIRLRLDPVAHRFEPGVRIRLQVSGGAHPRYARNLGTGLDPATSSDLAVSNREVFHGAGGFSQVFLPCGVS